MTSPTSTPQSPPRWFQGVPRYAWIVLIIAALGWLFDAMDQNLFTLVRQPSLTELMKPHVPAAQLADTVKMVGGQITSIFLIGWAIGGFFFGMVGDRLGRTRTMMITILIYAIFTGLNGLVKTPMQYGLCRFLTALGVGGEFAAGAALVAEVWPERSRAMALGLLQALSAIGNIGASLINLAAGADWRYVYFAGAAPALMVLWIRSSVREPEKWQNAVGKIGISSPEVGNIFSLFREPILRRNTFAGVLLATAGVGGMWGVGFFLPDLVGDALKPLIAGMAETAGKTHMAHLKSYVFIVQNVGAAFGMFSYALLSERTGRKPALAFFLIAAFLSIQLAFWGVRDLPTAFLFAFILGFCALAPFSAYAVYFPELYPTRLRATGVGFCYNCARLLAALAPFALGSLSKMFADPKDHSYGLRVAASIVSLIYVAGIFGLMIAPETKGKPLPE